MISDKNKLPYLNMAKMIVNGVSVGTAGEAVGLSNWEAYSVFEKIKNLALMPNKFNTEMSDSEMVTLKVSDMDEILANSDEWLQHIDNLGKSWGVEVFADDDRNKKEIVVSQENKELYINIATKLINGIPVKEIGGAFGLSNMKALEIFKLVKILSTLPDRLDAALSDKQVYELKSTKLSDIRENYDFWIKRIDKLAKDWDIDFIPSELINKKEKQESPPKVESTKSKDAYRNKDVYAIQDLFPPDRQLDEDCKRIIKTRDISKILDDMRAKKSHGEVIDKSELDLYM